MRVSLSQTSLEDVKMRYILMFTRNMLVVLLISSFLSCGASKTHHTLDTQPIRESGPFQYQTPVKSEINSHVVHKHETEVHSSYVTERIIFWSVITTAILLQIYIHTRK